VKSFTVDDNRLPFLIVASRHGEEIRPDRPVRLSYRPRLMSWRNGGGLLPTAWRLPAAAIEGREAEANVVLMTARTG